MYGHLSKATCLIRPRLCHVFRRVKDHHKLQTYSPLLKKSCVSQVVLDKWFPVKHTEERQRARAPARVHISSLTEMSLLVYYMYSKHVNTFHNYTNTIMLLIHVAISYFHI